MLGYKVRYREHRLIKTVGYRVGVTGGAQARIGLHQRGGFIVLDVARGAAIGEQLFHLRMTSGHVLGQMCAMAIQTGFIADALKGLRMAGFAFELELGMGRVQGT